MTMIPEFEGNEMKRLTYVGDVKQLRGERALVYPDGRAQFDNVDLQCPETGEHLGIGWHQFDITDFKETYDYENENEHKHK